MLGVHLRKGEPFKDMPEIYVIFICEHDVIGNGRPVNSFSYLNDDTYRGDETVEEALTPHESMRGRTHIIFVNGDYQDSESELGKLIHDLKCSDPDEMYFDEMAQRMSYLKTDPGEVQGMCEILEKVKYEGIKIGVDKNKRDTALAMLRYKLPVSLDVVAMLTNLSIEDVTAIAEGLNDTNLIEN